MTMTFPVWNDRIKEEIHFVVPHISECLPHYSIWVGAGILPEDTENLLTVIVPDKTPCLSTYK